jgi:hypothetical protein
MSELAPLPQGVGGSGARDLVNAINDRLRRIGTGIQQVTKVAAAAPPPVAARAGLNAITVSTTPYNLATDDDIIVLVSGASVLKFPQFSTIPLRHVYSFVNHSGVDCTLTTTAGDTIANVASFVIPYGAAYEIVPNT